jgi:hypothetical protein
MRAGVHKNEGIQPINIVQAKVERSLLCLAIGHVTFNLTVTIDGSGLDRSLANCVRVFAVRTFALVLGMAVVASMAACSESSAAGNITAADLKNLWPLTVDTVTVHCIDRNTVNLESNGAQYTLIGRQEPNNAKGWKPRTEIWAMNEATSGARRDIGELVDVATKRCAEGGHLVGG